ncbi:MAG: c-type cytochrome domain-containing protein, partial [Runella zeae]
MTFLNKALFIATAALVLGYGYHTLRGNEVDFNTQVKPIINKKCMACHGGVKKAGGFSLLFEEEALAKTKSGKPAIVPGDADASAFITCLTTSDPDKRMPKKGDPLSEEEVEILTDWVNQGAKWGKHWAYETVQKPEVPKPSWWEKLTSDSIWAKTDIDYFVEEKSKKEGLKHAPEANRA